MALYMTQFSYTPEAWAALLRNPVDRSEALGRLAEQLEAPDDATAAAIVLAAVSPGHVKSTKTTRLLTVEEAMEAMRKAGSVTYRAPG
jgi:hypothetical protein